MGRVKRRKGKGMWCDYFYSKGHSSQNSRPQKLYPHVMCLAFPKTPFHDSHSYCIPYTSITHHSIVTHSACLHLSKPCQNILICCASTEGWAPGVTLEGPPAQTNDVRTLHRVLSVSSESVYESLTENIDDLLLNVSF